MDEIRVTEYIREAFADVQVESTGGYTFFFYGSDRKLPFATLATSDNEYDRASKLDRPGVYRLNIGVSRDTFTSLFGPEPQRLGSNGVVETSHDFSALNRLLPHPVYAPQSWVCVLSPDEDTFETVQSMLAEAYDRAVRRAKRMSATESPERST